MTNAQIADVFDQIADLLEFQGANPLSHAGLSQRRPAPIRDLTESRGGDPGRTNTRS